MMMIGDFLRDTSGATAVEYGLIAALIAVATITGMQLTGTSVDELYQQNTQRVGEQLYR